jgi:hypothetical protein
MYITVYKKNSRCRSASTLTPVYGSIHHHYFQFAYRYIYKDITIDKKK